MESFSEAKQLARVKAGFKGGGPFFGAYVGTPKHTFVNGYPASTDAQLKSGPIKALPIMDPWVSRRSK